MAILMFLAGLAAALTPADAEPPTPTVKIVNSNPLTVLLTSVPGGPFTSSFNLNVENDGPEIIASTDFTFTIVSDYPISSGDEPTIAPGKVGNLPVSLGPKTVTSVPVTLTVHDTATATLTAVLTITSSSRCAPKFRASSSAQTGSRVDPRITVDPDSDR